MRIPKKINHINLKDSIVQVIFNSKIPQEAVIGAAYNMLSSHFSFISPPNKPEKIKTQPQVNFPIIIGQEGFFLDHEEKVKITITPNTINFNSYKEYPGWDYYFGIITTTIHRLIDAQIFNNVIRVSVRYINQYLETNLFNNLNVKLDLSGYNEKLESTQIRSEYTEGEYRIILTLANGIPHVLNTQDKVSLIDVDVIRILKENHTWNEITENIYECHQKEKDVFFSLLKQEFLLTLNPEY